MISLPKLFKMSKELIEPNIIYSISSIFYSLFLVLFKYAINEFYISPFKACLIAGLISIVFEFPELIIYSLIKNQDLSVFQDIFDFSKAGDIATFISCYIIYFLSGIITVVITLLVLFYFPSLLLIVTEELCPFLVCVYQMFDGNQETIDIILYLIGYLIVVLSSFLFNEIIIFNFWDLSSNTKKYVSMRSISESSDIKKMEMQVKSNDFNDIYLDDDSSIIYV